MNLIDRFIEFNDWPTSRKSMLLMLVAFVFHLLLAPLAYYFGTVEGIADPELRFPTEFYGVMVTLVCFLISLLAAKANVEGRWTAYLIVLAYGGWVVLMCYQYGLWDTAYLAWAPAVLILVTLWFDAVIGLFSFLFAVMSLSTVTILILNGVLPFAPIYLDRGIDSHASGYWALSMLAPVAGIIVFSFTLSLLTVIARNRQSANLHEAHNQIRRYMPSQVAKKIIAGEHIADLKPERVKLTMFFSDVEGFTTSSDHLEPEELASVLNEYLSEMADIAQEYGATIDQFMGDGIMLFFGAPEATTDKDHAVRAVSMALDMQKKVAELNDMWIEHGIRTPFRARMAINTGFASVGDFGSRNRKSYTAIGIQTNIAARIQAECEPGKVLITDATWALVKDEFDCSNKGEYELKGVHYPVKVYEVIGKKGSTEANISSGRVVPLNVSHSVPGGET